MAVGALVAGVSFARCEVNVFHIVYEYLVKAILWVYVFHNTLVLTVELFTQKNEHRPFCSMVTFRITNVKKFGAS